VSRVELVSLGVGILQIVLALVVARRLARFGRVFPWLGALTAYFALRGVTRILDAFAGIVVEALALPVDLLLIAVLLLLILGFDRTTRALLIAQDEARYREEEYERALTDYRRLARHRLANPLTAIKGGIAALKAFPELDAARRVELLDAIEAQSRRLEQVALEPEPLGPEEQGLLPRPMLPEHDRG
jgi:signal transduction histidine kinase